MNATKYQTFLKTVECGSFTKAAEERAEMPEAVEA